MSSTYRNLTPPPPAAFTVSKHGQKASPASYRKMRELGSGNFGKVYLGASPEGSEYAVKELNLRGGTDRKSIRKKQRAIWEVRVSAVAGCGHPFIVSYKEAMADQSHNVFIVMELARGGSLRDKLLREIRYGAWPEDKVRKYFVQASLAVLAVHNAKILHRDLKTENMFLNENDDVMLGDFGFGRPLEDGEWASTRAGSSGYMAPEMFSRQPYRYAADMYSMGAILYELMNGVVPQMPQYGYAAPQLRFPSTYSAELTALCRRLLSPDPYQRPTAKQVIAEPCMKKAMEAFPSEQRALFQGDGTFIMDEKRARWGSMNAKDIQVQIIGASPGPPPRDMSTVTPSPPTKDTFRTTRAPGLSTPTRIAPVPDSTAGSSSRPPLPGSRPPLPGSDSNIAVKSSLAAAASKIHEVNAQENAGRSPPSPSVSAPSSATATSYTTTGSYSVSASASVSPTPKTAQTSNLPAYPIPSHNSPASSTNPVVVPPPPQSAYQARTSVQQQQHGYGQQQYGYYQSQYYPSYGYRY